MKKPYAAMLAVAVGFLTASCVSDVVSMAEEWAHERDWKADVRYVGEWEKLHGQKFLESNPAVKRFHIYAQNSVREFAFDIEGNISNWEHLEPLFSALKTGYGCFMETTDDPRGLRSMTSNAGLNLGWGETPVEYADLSFLKNTRIGGVSLARKATLKSLAGIEDSEVRSFSVLNAAGIRDYTPLQRTGIVSLLLDNAAHLTDLKVISMMKKLEHLELRRSGASNLSPLAGNDTIEYLAVWNSPVTDLTPLASMKKLKHISLKNVPITTLEGPAANQGLEYISIVNTPVKDLSALTKLPRLRKISISGDEAENMTIPEALKSRVELYGSIPAEPKK